MDAFSLVASLRLDTSEYDEALGKAKDKLPEFNDNVDKTTNSTNKLAAAFKVAGAAIGTALTAAAAGATALVKQSVSSFGEYEQLVGGAQLMFGDAYDVVAEKAANAYKTVQMSQNDYLKQVNGFATGLKTALGGNEVEAAELADKIVRAEADIVAATGNTREAVENAFNGIMRSNYTMLDNLQLGITPTKAGFQEVIDKVNKWNAANGKATNYVIDNLADAQNALVDYIEMQGLAEYASMEAGETIQGSVASISAAWQNLLTGMANSDANISELMGNVVDAATGTLNNLIPVAEQAVKGLGVVVEKAAPIITDTLPSLIDELLPPILDTASSLVGSVTQALPDILGTVVDVIPGLITDISATLISAVPQLVGVAKDLVVGLAKGIGQAAPTLLKSAAEAVGEIAKELTKPDGLREILNAGLELVTGLAKGIGEALPVLADAAVDVVLNLVDFLTDPENIVNIVTAAGEIVIALGKGLVEAVPKIVSAILTIPQKIIDGLFSKDWNGVGGDIVSNIADGFINNRALLSDAFGGALGIIDSLLGTNLNKWYNDVREWSKNVGSEIYQGLHAGENAARDEKTEADWLRYNMETEYRDTLRDTILQGKTLSSSDIEKMWSDVFNKYVIDEHSAELFSKYINDIDYERLSVWARSAADEADERRSELEAEIAAVSKSSMPSSFSQKEAQIRRYIESQQEVQEEIVTAIGEYANLGVIEQIGKELSEEEKNAQRLAKDVYSASKEYVERQTKYLSLSYNDQISMWEKIKGQFIEGSEQYLDAEEKIFDIRQKAISDQQKQAETAAKNAQKLEKEQTAALEKQLKEQEKAREEYAKAVDKIYSEVENIEKKYVDTLSSRTEEIYNSFGIFDEVPDRLLISGFDLTNNLRNQIDTISKFYSDLETLSARGVSESLVSEIRSMGVGALDQLDALLDLSNAELQEYDSLLEQKRELSAEIAESELEGLRADTNQQIADKMTELEALSAETAENLGLTFAESIAEGIRTGTTEIASAAEEALTTASNVFGTATVARNTTVQTVNSAETTNASQTAGTSSNRNGYTFNININGIQYQNITELAQAVSEEIQFTIERTEKGYAGA